MKHLNQSMSKIIQLIDESQSALATLILPKAAMNTTIEEDGLRSVLEANIFEKISASKSKEFEKDYKWNFEILTPSVQTFTE